MSCYCRLLTDHECVDSTRLLAMLMMTTTTMTRRGERNAADGMADRSESVLARRRVAAMLDYYRVNLEKKKEEKDGQRCDRSIGLTFVRSRALHLVAIYA